MPRLEGLREGADPAELLKQVSAYPHKDRVAFWMLGQGLGRKRELKTRDAELTRTRKLIEQIHGLPGGDSHFTTAIVDGDLPLFARAPGTSTRSEFSLCSGHPGKISSRAWPF